MASSSAAGAPPVPGSNVDVEEVAPLKTTFDEGMKLLELVETGSEPTNSPTMQLSVKRAIQKFETATRHVSMLGLFSRNESIEEVTTESLQYLLLPALLGTLSLKLCEQSRREVIDLAEIYFRDFLQRCKDYGVTNIEIPRATSSEEEEVSTTNRNQTEQQKIAYMVLSRDSKIKRYKEQKELKDKLVTLKKAMQSEIIDEQRKREYFSTLLLNYVNQSLDELSSIEQEKPILQYMSKHAGEPKPKPVRSTPLKPIIITRDEVQKAVFGLGYPSIPTLTIEEFYDQRVREGTFPAPGTTNIPNTNIQSAEKTDEDAELVRREQLREKDDPEELQRQRNMDEYKDEHRRGEGNRYNRS